MKSLYQIEKEILFPEDTKNNNIFLNLIILAIFFLHGIHLKNSIWIFIYFKFLCRVL